MGSIVEVRHHFPAMLGADQHQTPRSSHHRPPLAPHSQSDSSSASSVSTVRPRSTDIAMADAAITPPRSVPPSLASRQSSHPMTRELAFHSVAPPYRAAPTIQTSSVHASPHLSTGSLGPVGSSGASSVQNSPRRSMNTQSPLSLPSPPRIKVKSLSHIQSFVIDDTNPLSPSRNPSRIAAAAGRDTSPQYEISEMPVAEIIEMVAGLLTKITTTNDRQHEYLHRHIPPSENGQALSQQTTSVLAFHGKNVPSISILSYLSRIHKYCPTTYEVFLSLLVYFDRMTERVNSGPIQSLRQANQQSVQRHRVSLDGRRHGSISSAAIDPQMQNTQTSTPPPSGSLGASPHVTSPVRHNAPPSPPLPIYPSLDNDSTNLSHFFVVDSFNIHRLVIAGVTCASKFFSDIFYTNSRYAKVRVYVPSPFYSIKLI
jgi:PHO85 cyclin-6/7